MVLDNLGIDLDSVLCPRCGYERETTDNALVGCPDVREVWKAMGCWWNRDTEGSLMIQDISSNLGQHLGITSKPLEVWLGVKWSFLYLIW